MTQKILLPILLLLCAHFTYAQVNWKQLPPNPQFSNANTYETAIGPNNEIYQIYAIYNSSTFYFDVFVDQYTAINGWQTIGNFATTNNQSVFSFATAKLNGYPVFSYSTNGGTAISTVQIIGNTTNILTTQNITGYDPYGKAILYAGPGIGELYYATFSAGNLNLNTYNSGTNSWVSQGMPFSTSGLYLNSGQLYANQDSLFIVAPHYFSPDNHFRIMAANKSNFIFNNYSALNGDLYEDVSGTPVDVSSSSEAYFYGDGIAEPSVIVYQNSTPVEIRLTGNAFSSSIPFPLEFDFSTKVVGNTANNYMLTSSSNTTNTNVVYGKPTTGGAWTQVTGTGYASNTITPSQQSVHTNTLNRTVVGYIDYTNTPADFLVKITNNVPSLSDSGQVHYTVCASGFSPIDDNLILEDLDTDNLSLVNATSNNNGVINPSNINVVLNPIAGVPTQTSVTINATIGAVASATPVVLNFTFTDGYDLLTYTLNLTVQPLTPVTFSSDTLKFCADQGIVELNDYVSNSGGSFGISGTTVEHELNITELIGFSNLFYSVPLGGCTSNATTVLAVYENPSVNLTATAATSCVATDGQISASISGGALPYEYVWNTGELNLLTLTGIAAGEYHLNVVDGKGCSSSGTEVIENNAVSISGVISNVSCFGSANGAINTTLTGFTAPYTILWSSGYSTEDITNVQPGTHTINVSDANGCTGIKHFTVTQPQVVNFSLFSTTSTCGSATGTASASLEMGGDGNYSYLWASGETSPVINGKPSGVYSLTVSDGNGCAVTKQIAINDQNAPMLAYSTVYPSNCGTPTGAIYLDTIQVGTNTQFDWSNGASTLYQENIAAGTYVFHVFNNEGCDAYNFFEIALIAPMQQPICIITVDSTTTSNVIVWEKLDPTYIDHYSIYRETIVPGEYMLIDTVQNSNPSIFNDVVINPGNHSWKYKIAAVDQCGTQSNFSTPHKTIHLTSTDSGTGSYSIAWNYYAGTAYNQFNLYRYTQVNGWEIIATLPATLNNYVDVPPSTIGLDYIVNFDLTSPCTADFLKAQDFNTVRSNRERGSLAAGQGTGDSNNGLAEASNIEYTIYPNPAFDALNVVLSDAIGSYEVVIYDALGVRVYASTLKTQEATLNISQLTQGLYFMQLNGSNNLKKFVKQ